MSTMMRYQFHISFPSIAKEAAEAREERDIRTAMLKELLQHEYTIDEHDAFDHSVTLWGQSSDWSRPNEVRHKVVVDLVRGMYPGAAVNTAWLNVDMEEWDETFDTEDEDVPVLFGRSQIGTWRRFAQTHDCSPHTRRAHADFLAGKRCVQIGAISYDLYGLHDTEVMLERMSSRFVDPLETGIVALAKEMLSLRLALHPEPLGTEEEEAGSTDG